MSNRITNLQIELMKIFSYEVSETELLEIKHLLANYFAKKADDEMDTLWDESKWTTETMDKWLKQHNRSEYS
ncbi:hypothetical protein MCHI_000123 [Candidatus Magnetoovum chiemensis]|nr:hypothetical protein MCHI_000123 [Candidatus Magnetoovum chiemensis]